MKCEKGIPTVVFARNNVESLVFLFGDTSHWKYIVFLAVLGNATGGYYSYEDTTIA